MAEALLVFRGWLVSEAGPGAHDPRKGSGFGSGIAGWWGHLPALGGLVMGMRFREVRAGVSGWVGYGGRDSRGAGSVWAF